MDKEAWLWLLSINSLRYRGHRIDVTHEASAFARNCDVPDCNHAAGSVVGIVKLKKLSLYSQMAPIDESMQQQLTFWQHLCNRRFEDGELCILEFSRATLLQHITPVQQLSCRKLRGLVVQLELGQPDSLLSVLDSGTQGLMSNVKVNVGLRMPLQFAFLCATRCWKRVMLPHMPARKSSGASGLSIDFKLLGTALHLIPLQVPLKALNAPQNACLDQPLLLFSELLKLCVGVRIPCTCDCKEADCIQFLRLYAETLTPGLQDDSMDAERTEFRLVERCVLVLSQLFESMDSTAFLREARNMTGKANTAESRLGLKRPFQVAYMVKVLCMADLLRSQSTVTTALQSAMEIAMPRVLRPAFKTLLAEHKTVIPHESTISRWRMLLDGALMLVSRARHWADGHVRFIMTDGSTQHKRHVQHTLVRSVRKSDVVRLYGEATHLATIWC
eukprot:6474145-Amphidinium_carterae.2